MMLHGCTHFEPSYCPPLRCRGPLSSLLHARCCVCRAPNKVLPPPSRAAGASWRRSVYGAFLPISPTVVGPLLAAPLAGAPYGGGRHPGGGDFCSPSGGGFWRPCRRPGGGSGGWRLRGCSSDWRPGGGSGGLELGGSASHLPSHLPCSSRKQLAPCRVTR